MDMAFDLENTAARRNGDGTGVFAAHPSWPELLTRMVAARQASAEFTKGIHQVSAAEHGSFDESVAARVASQAQWRMSVNPIDLGNSKPGGAIASPVAGVTRTGGRG
jgi:hypothetical protein